MMAKRCVALIFILLAFLCLAGVAGAAGRVVDEEGQPVRAEVHIHPDYPDFNLPRPLVKRLQAQHNSWEAVTDDQGRWTVETLLGDFDYNVWVRMPDGKSGDTQFTAKPGEMVKVDDIVVKPKEQTEQ